MEKIARTTLINMGGAPDARYAIFNPDGSLYCCTTHLATDLDDEFWRNREHRIKEVVDETH